jgi:hypothetical protein
VRDSRSQTVDEIAAAAGISHGTFHKIQSDDLNTSRVTQDSVPRVLTQDQRNYRMSICDDLIDSAEKVGEFLNQIITGEETWGFSIQSTTEAKIDHLKIVIIAKKEAMTE